MATATARYCSACGSDDLQHVREISVQASAAHLIPPLRSPERHQALGRELHYLWGCEAVQIRRCRGCGFGFSDPFVAGTAAIYNLIGGGDQHYPGERFEFTQTIEELRRRGGVGSLLEVGAGSGAFLRKVIDANLAKTIIATEYDDSAVRRLRQLSGVTVFQGDLQALAQASPDQHDVICMFQVLEHMDRLDSVFAALRQLTCDDGEIFIAVPNHGRVEVQEHLTGFLDMPPVHIGRWTNQALTAIAGQYGFRLVESRLDHRSHARELWELAKYGLEARTRRRYGLAAWVEALSFRPLRGALKRAAAVGDLLRLAPQYGQIPPATRWFRLHRGS